MAHKYKNTELEMSRKQGYRRGLNVARDMMRRAKNYQNKCAKGIPEVDSDLRGEHEHAAGVLHDLCARVGELIKDAR